VSEALVGYEVFDPGVYGPWKNLPRSQARKVIDRLLSQKEARIDQLRTLVRRSGIRLPRPETATDEDLDALTQWFFASIEPDANNPQQLAPAWYSVVSDIGLYVGEVIIARGRGLEWRMYTADRRSESYQELVIMGFPVPNPKYFLNPGFRVANWALCRLRGDYVPDHPMVEMVRIAVATSDTENY
jgi:hypothetical protein